MLKLGPRAVRPVTEISVMRECIVALNRIKDVRVTRNNSGALLDINGRLVRFGLGEGSPDIVGLLTVRGVGVAFGLEIKRPGGKTGKQHLARQVAWRKAAERRGMFCEEVRSVEDALSAVDRFRERVSMAMA